MRESEFHLRCLILTQTREPDAAKGAGGLRIHARTANPMPTPVTRDQYRGNEKERPGEQKGIEKVSRLRLRRGADGLPDKIECKKRDRR